MLEITIDHLFFIVLMGIKQDPFKDFTNTFKDANERIKNGMRKKDDKNKD